MCGIVGYVGKNNAQEFLLSGLKRLEYRGYDSAGVATLDQNQKPTLLRAVGKIVNLEVKIKIIIRLIILVSAILVGLLTVIHPRPMLTRSMSVAFSWFITVLSKIIKP